LGWGAQFNVFATEHRAGSSRHHQEFHMTLSMYQASVPSFVHFLNNLSAIIDKAEAHCAEKKIDPSILINFRLRPDMLPFARQIQIATDGVKGCPSRLAGAEVPSFPDTETTFAELKARIAKTIAHVKSFTPSQIDGSEDKDITLKFGPNEFKFKGQDYLTNFVLPNFYFHLTTAYAILRHCGVEIGKRDFLGG
jgi:hypothetical protein